MVGNGIQSKNVFAALDSLRKKKSSDKSRGPSKAAAAQEKEQESKVFWAPAPLTGTSWADVDDDDDYYATTAPPQSVWAPSEPEQKDERSTVLEEETESEVDYGDEDIDDEPEHEPEVVAPVESVVKKPTQASVPSREAERQLSKKELKKKELAELEAVLAEFGLTEKNNSNNVADEKEKPERPAGDVELKDNSSAAPTESKTSKKKKKKDKAPKEKDTQEQTNGPDKNVPQGATGNEPAGEETSAADMKERLKKMASMKKKKSSKEMDSAAKAAATEAAARSARLAAAKKRDKNHYNQQPVR